MGPKEGYIRVYCYVNDEGKHAWLLEQYRDGRWEQVDVVRTPEAMALDMKEYRDGEQ